MAQIRGPSDLLLAILKQNNQKTIATIIASSKKCLTIIVASRCFAFTENRLTGPSVGLQVGYVWSFPTMSLRLFQNKQQVGTDLRGRDFLAEFTLGFGQWWTKAVYGTGEWSSHWLRSIQPRPKQHQSLCQTIPYRHPRTLQQFARPEFESAETRMPKEAPPPLRQASGPLSTMRQTRSK